MKLTGIAPEESPPSLVMLVALAPAILMGLLLFRVPALEMLALALAIGLVAHLLGRAAGHPVGEVLVLPALVAVAFVGPRASLAWAALAAAVAVTLELLRARWMPGARVQVGLLAYAVVLLASWWGVAAYVQPGDVRPAAEPVRLWLQLGAPAQPLVADAELYVGNVPGPLFATSLAGVAVGAAWLWYARRLSLLTLLTFLTGALVPLALNGWPADLTLISGPLWFAAAFILADRRTLPPYRVARPLFGFAAGVVALAPRARGLGIESAVLAVAGMQLVVALVEGGGWLIDHRELVRTRLRELRAAALTRAPG